MTSAVFPIGAGLNFGGIVRSGSMSNYMEDNSLFATPYMNYGLGLSPQMYEQMGVMSDNMTSLTFKQRSNQHVLGSFNEIMQKNMPEMAEALREGKAGKAAMIYDEVYNAISKNYGEEITTQEQRVAFDQSIKATIAKSYEKINGYPLANDIRENCDGYFMNGVKQVLSFGTETTNSAEELESYMLGTGIEGHGLKKVKKFIGGIVGTALAGAAGAAITAACITIAGATATAAAVLTGGLIVAGVAAGAGLLCGAFGSNKPSKVESPY